MALVLEEPRLRFDVVLDQDKLVDWHKLVPRAEDESSSSATEQKAADDEGLFWIEYLRKSSSKRNVASAAAVAAAVDAAAAAAAGGKKLQKRIGVKKEMTKKRVRKADDQESAAALKKPKLEAGAEAKRSKDGNGSSPKKASCKVLLDRAMQELERLVSDMLEVTDIGTSGSQEQQLPKELEEKLAKVARLAGCRVAEEELLSRLMKSMHHFMNANALQQSLEDMLELEMAASKEKASKLECIKEEVEEMVKSGRSCNDDFYNWDAATEDRLCEYYEAYLAGKDGEQRGGSARKFYTDAAAELWPEGLMDSNDVRRAVLRAKKRKKSGGAAGAKQRRKAAAAAAAAEHEGTS